MHNFSSGIDIVAHCFTKLFLENVVWGIMRKHVTNITRMKNFLTLNVKEHTYTKPRHLLLKKKIYFWLLWVNKTVKVSK